MNDFATAQATQPGQGPARGIVRQLLSLAGPMAAGVMVQTCYHLVNAFWVGRVGAEAVAVVALSYPVNLILIAFGSGLSLAGSILIAQRHGAGEQRQVMHLAGQVLSGLTLLALAISALGVLVAPAILKTLNAADNVFDDSVAYLRILLAGSVFVFIGMSYQSVLRALGETRAPLFVIIPSVFLNAALDPLLIFGWGPVPAMGVRGAACATVITQACAAALGIYLMLRPRFGVQLHRQDLVPRWGTISNLLRIGFPASIEQSTGALTVAVITTLAAQFGNIPLAAYGIVFRIMTFTIIPAMSVGMATSILLSHALGSGNGGRARHIAIAASKLNCLLMATIGAGLFLGAEPIAAFFVPGEPELIDYCAKVLHIFALAYPLSGLQMALTSAFRGAGDTLTVMIISLAGAWLVQVPLGIMLSQYSPLRDMGLWWANVIAACISATVVLIYFRSNRWQANANRNLAVRSR